MYHIMNKATFNNGFPDKREKKKNMIPRWSFLTGGKYTLEDMMSMLMGHGQSRANLAAAV